MITKLDVLTGFEKIPVCVAYDVEGVRYDEMPYDQPAIHHARPVYEYLDGWTEDISGAREFGDLPVNAQRYLDYLSRSRAAGSPRWASARTGSRPSCGCPSSSMSPASAGALGRPPNVPYREVRWVTMRRSGLSLGPFVVRRAVTHGRGLDR